MNVVTRGLLIGTYVDSKVLAQFRPEVAPNEHIAVGVVEVLIPAMIVGCSPDAHVCYTWGVRAVIDAIVEVLVAGKPWSLATLFADQDLQSKCQSLRHAVDCNTCQSLNGKKAS